MEELLIPPVPQEFMVHSDKPTTPLPSWVFGDSPKHSLKRERREISDAMLLLHWLEPE